MMKKSLSILLTLLCIVLTGTTVIRAETIYTDKNALQGVSRSRFGPVVEPCN